METVCGRWELAILAGPEFGAQPLVRSEMGNRWVRRSLFRGPLAAARQHRCVNVRLSRQSIPSLGPLTRFYCSFFTEFEALSFQCIEEGRHAGMRFIPEDGLRPSLGLGQFLIYYFGSH